MIYLVMQVILYIKNMLPKKSIISEFFIGWSVDIEIFWTEDYAGQIPNRGLWLVILLLWL